MIEEEIEKRISICEERRRSYLEVGNTKIADKYSNEIYKWVQLLNKLDSKRDEQLRDYKIGYELLKKALNEIRKCCENNVIEVDTREYGNLVVINTDDILQIIDEVLGDDKR